MEALPNGHTSPVHPFTGFVLNINVSTRIHRDWGDEDICLVLVLSDCSGGELCLKEPGVVLKMNTGDIIIFKSAEISHFNLHYAGKRASLVFHTDRAAKSWAKDRNGWQHNIHMLSTLSTDSDSDSELLQNRRKKKKKKKSCTFLVLWSFPMLI